MSDPIDHPAVDIGTVTILGQTVRVCGRCLKAVDLHPPAAERTDADADTPLD